MHPGPGRGAPARRASPRRPKLLEAAARTPTRGRDSRRGPRAWPRTRRRGDPRAVPGRDQGARAAGSTAGSGGRGYLLNAPIDVQVDGLGPVAGGAGSHLALSGGTWTFYCTSRRQPPGEGGPREEGVAGAVRGRRGSANRSGRRAEPAPRRPRLAPPPATAPCAPLPPCSLPSPPCSLPALSRLILRVLIAAK